MEKVELLRQLFKYQTRRRLFVNCYRDILKQSQTYSDPIVQGHIKIKARYIVDKVQNVVELERLAENYRLLEQLRSNMISGNEKQLTLEAYGVIHEPEIDQIMRQNAAPDKDKLGDDQLDISPRHISTLILKANKQFKLDQGERFVSWDNIDDFELPPNLEQNID